MVNDNMVNDMYRYDRKKSRRMSACTLSNPFRMMVSDIVPSTSIPWVLTPELSIAEGQIRAASWNPNDAQSPRKYRNGPNRTLVIHRALDCDTIRAYSDRVDWAMVVLRQRLDEDLLDTILRRPLHLTNPQAPVGKDLSDSSCPLVRALCRQHILSEEFIRAHANMVHWPSVSVHQPLSEGFIREFEDRLNWEHVSRAQRLSEGFMREFEDRLNWLSVSRTQRLSEAFIEEFEDRIDWNSVFEFQAISYEFRERHRDKPGYARVPPYEGKKAWMFQFGFSGERERGQEWSPLDVADLYESWVDEPNEPRGWLP